MSSRDLPARPNLDHLKHEAKALHKAFDEGDATAIQRVRQALGEKDAVKLTDAQRVIAREYGFPTWARLREHVQSSRGPDEAIAEFLLAVQEQDVERARRVLRARPTLAGESLHVACVLGLTDDARRLIAENPDRVNERVGNPAADPLLFLCFSPFHGEGAERDAGLLATAKLLLESGADPNSKDGRYGVPALYAVTGMHKVLPIARLLLDNGANPTDGESVFHAAQHDYEDALELLLQYGAQLNYVGEWGNTAIFFLLRWHDLEREATVRRGFVWLLDHGADPNVVCGKEGENSLHLAARRGQAPAIVQLLLDHGADINARRADGATAWLIARRGGFDAVAQLLENAGAQTAPLSPLDLLLAACGRGDADAARRLTSPELIASLSPMDRQLLPESAAGGREPQVLACVAAGFPVNTTDHMDATALHYAAIEGRASLVRTLLAAGARIDLRDNEHSSTPLGWATFGADHVAKAGGDYEGVVLALLEAGARPREDEYRPQHAGVQTVLRRFSGP